MEEGKKKTEMQQESLSDFRGTTKLGVRSQKKVKKRRGKRNPLKNNTPEKDKISGPLVRLLWRAAAKAPPLAARPNKSSRSSEKCFPRRIGNRRITFGYNLWFASHPRCDTFSEYHDSIAWLTRLIARTPFGRTRGFSEWLSEDTFRR